MPYELQLNPFVRKDGWKYKVIRITDFALHTTQNPPTSIGKKIRKSFKHNQPGRIYGSIKYSDSAPFPENTLSILDLIKKDPEFLKFIEEQEKNGYKVLLELPKEIPVVAGKDTIEFMASINGKRILKGLAKNNVSS